MTDFSSFRVRWQGFFKATQSETTFAVSIREADERVRLRVDNILLISPNLEVSQPDCCARHINWVSGQVVVEYWLAACLAMGFDRIQYLWRVRQARCSLTKHWHIGTSNGGSPTR